MKNIFTFLFSNALARILSMLLLAFSFSTAWAAPQTLNIVSIERDFSFFSWADYNCHNELGENVLQIHLIRNPAGQVKACYQIQKEADIYFEKQCLNLEQSIKFFKTLAPARHDRTPVNLQFDDQTGILQD